MSSDSELDHPVFPADRRSLHYGHTMRGRLFRPRVLIFWTVVLVIAITIFSRLSPTSVKALVPDRILNSETIIQYNCGECIPGNVTVKNDKPWTEQDWIFNYERDATDYGLSDDQCLIAFPGLFTEVERTVKHYNKRGHITLKDLNENKTPEGTLRCMVYDGHLYIIEVHGVVQKKFASRGLATLHSINRALLAARESRNLPNFEFMMNINDKIDFPLVMFSFTRRPQEELTWVMPDFGFYSWPEPGVGSYMEVLERIEDVEDKIPSWKDKIPKLIWRGTLGMASDLRQALIDSAEGKEWADIALLHWGDADELKELLVPIEDHCKYMFIAHTEGRSFSGRHKYIQNCRSVIIAHRMQWVEPFAYMMVPNGTKQNYVEVERDFSDLDEKISYYIENPKKAEQIAINNERTFKKRYLTPAAEACYWRRLFRGYASVSFRPNFYKKTQDGKREWRGVPFESYAMLQKVHWDPS